MNPPDEPLLGAFLDDELDPESRLLVEQARRADPRVDRTLYDLSRVSGLVAGLHRPAEAPDVSDAVLAEIRRSSARRRALPSFVAAAALAAAALLMVPILSHLRHLDRADRDEVGLLAHLPTGEAGPDRDVVSGEASPADAPTSALASTEAPEPDAPPPMPAPALADLGTSPEQIGRLRFFLDLMEHPTRRRFTIEATPGTPARELLDELEGILIDIARDDPRYALIPTDRPGEADAIAFIASPAEQRLLADLVDERLGDRSLALRPADGTLVEAGALIAGLGGIVLRDAVQPARLLPVDPDQFVAAKQRPQDEQPDLGGLTLHSPLHGGQPVVSASPAPPRLAPSPAAGVAAPGEEADVVFIRVLPADPGDR